MERLQLDFSYSVGNSLGIYAAKVAQLGDRSLRDKAVGYTEFMKRDVTSPLFRQIVGHSRTETADNGTVLDGDTRRFRTVMS